MFQRITHCAFPVDNEERTGACPVHAGVELGDAVHGPCSSGGVRERAKRPRASLLEEERPRIIPRHHTTDHPTSSSFCSDQLAYSDPELLGGKIRMPNLDKLAKNGLTYTNFHVNALCSPSRVSLLTGRNSHQCSVSNVVDASSSFPGDTGVRPASCATVGEIMQHWGYCTGYFGKCHEVPPYEVSVSGPFTRWPARCGWDKFYGYLAGEMTSLNPNLIDGLTHLPVPRDPNYHFNTDVTDKAITWVQATRSLTPDRPF